MKNERIYFYESWNIRIKILPQEICTTEKDRERFRVKVKKYMSSQSRIGILPCWYGRNLVNELLTRLTKENAAY